MKGMGIIRWCLAGAAVTSLAFGATQVLAAPGTRKADAWCEPFECRAMCGVGCGGTCIGNDCYCDC